MSRREDIENMIWHDAAFDVLSNDAALLYLWSFSNPRCGMSGLYKVSQRQLLEGRLARDELADAIGQLQARRFAYYREDVFFVRTRVKHLRTRTVQMVKSILSDLEKIAPDHPLRLMFVDEYRESWLTKAIEAHSLEQAIFLRFDPTSGEVLGQGHGPGKGLGNGHVGGNVGSTGVLGVAA